MRGELQPAISAPERTRLAELETVVEQGLQTFIDVGLALKEIRDSKLYRQTHATFENYLDKRWQMSRRTGYKYIEAVGVVQNVPPAAQLSLTQAAEMASLTPEEQVEIAERVSELTKNETRKLVHEVKMRRDGGEQSDERRPLSKINWPGSPYALEAREHLARGETFAGPIPHKERELCTRMLENCAEAAEADYRAAVYLWEAGQYCLELERRHREEDAKPLSSQALCKFAAEIDGSDLAEINKPRMHAGIRMARAWPTHVGFHMAIEEHESAEDAQTSLWRYLDGVAKFAVAAA
jgi:hypothetical protein